MNSIIYAGKHFLTQCVSLHKHSTWELVYCTGRSGRFIFDTLEIPYAEGDIVVIPPETPHENVSENGFTNIHLNIDAVMLPFHKPALIRDDSNQALLHLFSDAYSLFCGEPERRAALLDAYGSLIVRCMAAYHTARPKNRIAEQIEQSIVHNYADANYDLDAVLHSMPYSYDYLCKMLRRELGMTPHKYLTNLRLQAAAGILCSVRSNGSITEVAQLCGFRNPLYFSRLFKKQYGVSPKEYYHQKMKAKHPDAGADYHKIILEK